MASFAEHPFRYAAAVAAAALMTGIAFAATPAADGSAEPLRICSDPTNLPFSSDDPAKPGFYNEIGAAIGEALGRPVAYHWYKSYFGKRTVRETLLSRQCDMMIGLPKIEDFMGPRVIFTRPIATEGYALVAEKGKGLDAIDDLKGLRVAVQFRSTPQNLLALRDEITKVTVLAPEQAMKELDSGAADAAFIWGPVAGWLNKTEYGDRFEIVPTAGEELQWDVAIGFSSKNKELRDEVDATLDVLKPRIAELAAKYGVPDAATPLEKKAEAAAAAPAEQQVAAATEPATGAGQAPKEGATDAVAHGRELFNGTCAHCHGPDAVQSERRADLRRLQKRHGEKMQDVFSKTVREGRPTKGMPALADAFSEEDFEAIYAFIQTVQGKE